MVPTDHGLKKVLGMIYYGINGGIYSLIESYLENRYQRVKYNNKLSNWGKINIGVPQGSILGPL
jgi:hypothetical protein